MTQNTVVESDESVALGLLKDHITARSEVGFSCDPNDNDPPDLIVTWEHGKRCGVEVSRTYQQVSQIGKPEVVSSASVVAFLQAFGNRLGKETEGRRHREYTLDLECPGPFSSWRRPVPKQEWTEKVKDLVLRHIDAGESEDLCFPGGRLRPGVPGTPWRVSVAYPVAKLESATTQMLRRVLEDKANDLPRWNGTFFQRWLLLLNCYPLVDDAAKVEGALRRLVRENTALARFDGVFWSGYPDRALIPIPLS
jgi:hypothetical protein